MLKALTRLRPAGLLFLLLVALVIGARLFTPSTPPAPPAGARVPVRWFAGLGLGATPGQIDAMEAVVADFNASQTEIELVLEVATLFGAYDMLATQLAAERGPDIVGPVDPGTAATFASAWQADGGGARPYALFPYAIYYVPELFDEAGVAYPPQTVGATYLLDGQARPWNWDTVAVVARRLTLDSAGYDVNDPRFDRRRVAQVGFQPEDLNPADLARFFGDDPLVTYSATRDARAVIPQSWRQAWSWWHDAVWGSQPFAANGNLANAAEFGSGAVFSAGKAAMSLGPVTNLCCLAPLTEQGLTFQLAALPAGNDNRVHHPMTSAAFYTWRHTPRTAAAAAVLDYLHGPGGAPLLAAYHGLPAAPGQWPAFVTRQRDTYPAVTDASWAVLGPNRVQTAPAPLPPHPIEVRSRLHAFGDFITNSTTVNMPAAITQLEQDLTFIVAQP